MFELITEDQYAYLPRVALRVVSSRPAGRTWLRLKDAEIPPLHTQAETPAQRKAVPFPICIWASFPDLTHPRIMKSSSRPHLQHTMFSKEEDVPMAKMLFLLLREEVKQRAKSGHR